jgi:hypothetical protein
MESGCTTTIRATGIVCCRLDSARLHWKPFPCVRERERERRKLGGGSERHYRLEGGVIET